MKSLCTIFIFTFVATLGLRAANRLVESVGSASQTALSGAGKTGEIGQMFYNPAVLFNEINGRTISVSLLGSETFDQNAFFGGYAWPIFSQHRLSFGLGYVRNSDLMAMNSAGISEGYFSAGEMLGGFSHSWALLKNLTFGETIKVYYFDYDRVKLVTYSGDVGTVYSPWPWLLLGANFSNLFSGEYRFVTEAEQFPFMVDLSPTFLLWSNRLRLHYSLRQYIPLYTDTNYSLEHRVGVEFDVYQKYFTLMSSWGPQGLGFGVASNISNYRFSIAYQPLAYQHQVNVSLTLNLDDVTSGPFRHPTTAGSSDLEQELSEFYDAMQAYNSGDYKAAYDRFNNVLRLNPDHEMAIEYKERSLLHLKTSNFIDQDDERLLKMHKDMALSYEKQDNFGEAIVEWRNVLQINPVDGEAEPNIERIKRKVQDRVIAFHKLGLQEYQSNHTLKAIDAFSNALRYNPEYEPSKGWLLKIKQEMSQEELRERERIDRTQQAEVFYNRGLSYYGRKTFEESIKEFDQALALNPAHENAKKYRKLAADELEAERSGLKGLEAARKLYEKGMKNYEGEHYYQAKKDFEASTTAYPAFKKALKMAPKAKERLQLQINPFILDGIANHKIKRFSKAEEKFNLALQLDPENTQAQEYLVRLKNERNAAIAFNKTEGVNAFNKDDFSKAIYHLDEVVKLDPSDKKSSAMLNQARDKVKAAVEKLHADAMTQFNAGNYDPAIVLWKKVIEIDAANKLAEKYIKESELKKKNTKMSVLAEAYLKRGKELYQNRDYEQALAFFVKVLDIDPRHQAALDFKELCEKEKDREKNQDKISELFIEAVREYKKREYEKAIAKWKEVLKLDPQNQLVEKYIAKAIEAQKTRKLIDFMNGQKFYGQGKWLLAKSSFERAIQEDPKNTKARSMLQDTLDRIAEERMGLLNEGDRKMRATQYTEAAGDYMAAFRLDNSATSQTKYENAIKAQEQFELGLRYLNSDQEVGLCIEPFLKVLELNPFDTRASDNIQKAKEIGKSRITSWMEQALRAESSKNFKAAYALYRSVQEIDPSNVEMKKGISRVRRELRTLAAQPYKEGKEAMALKNYTLATESFAKALDLVSDYEDAQTLLATAKDELARQRAASASSSSSGGGGASDADNALVNQGIVLYRRGKYKEAIAVWQKVPKSSEAYSKARKYIARAQLKL